MTGELVCVGASVRGRVCAVVRELSHLSTCPGASDGHDVTDAGAWESSRQRQRIWVMSRPACLAAGGQVTEPQLRLLTGYEHCCKTDVTPAIFSRNFVARVFSRDKIASVTWRVAGVFNSRATLFPNRALLYSVQLC